MLKTDDLDAELLTAAGDFDRWPALLDQIAAEHGADGAAILPVHDPSIMRHTRSMQSAFEAYIREGVYIDDPRLSLAPRLRERKVVRDLDAYSSDQIARMSYYQDWLPANGLGEFVGLRAGTPDRPVVLALYRTTHEAGFSAEERERLAPLSDALVRATALDRAVGQQVLAHQADWHEQTGAGVVGLERDGTVSFVGGTAERYLGFGLRIRHGRLAFANPNDERLFARALQQSNRIAHDAALGVSSALVRPDRVYLRAQMDWTEFSAAASPTGSIATTALDVHPIVAGYRSFVDTAHLVVLSDPFGGQQVETDAFIALWDLTCREATLVRHLVDGLLLAEAAARMGIRNASARSYLKSIYRKTGTRAQSELVARAAQLTR